MKKIEVVNKVTKLFSQLNWEIDEAGPFGRFCDALFLLSLPQQNCLLEISSNFLKVGQGKYPLYTKLAINLIDDTILNAFTKIYVLPLNVVEQKIESMRPVCERKRIGRSSDGIAYQFHDSDLIDHPKLRNKNVYVCFSLDDLPSNINIIPALILLVDDFIGSGETAIGCIDYLLNIAHYDIKKIAIMSLVSQIEGVEKIRNKGIEVYCSEQRNKGISDNYSSPKKDEFIALMKNIEDKIKVKEKYRFGYNHSEALVKMIRTPNNTFPVYWLKSKINNEQFCYPPFPR